MKNSEKAELRYIVRKIPKSEINYVKKWLHEKYAPDFKYATFVSYLNGLRLDALDKEVAQK